jgi:RNA 2',3'-cyclic 3'-phosphodiesterase
MIRIFIGLDLPEDIKRSLGLLKSSVRGAKWVPLENLHLTIRFIGEVPENILQNIKEELREISFYNFKVKLKGVGLFSAKSNPKVIWVGLDPLEEIMELREKIDEALTKVNIPLEKKKYIPHVTLARLKGARFSEVAEYLQQGIGFFTREFEFGEMVLFSSKQKEEGSIYSVEEIFKF